MNIDPIYIRFFLAVCLGALVGFERDENRKNTSKEKELSESAHIAAKKFSFIKEGHPANSIGGFRTYTLISILGALAGVASSLGVGAIAWIVAAGIIIFIQIAFLLNYFDKNSLGLTTEVSIILVFLFSFLLLGTDISVNFIVMVAVISAFVLSMRNQLHAFSGLFSHEEVIDTIKFLLFTAVIIPLLPNQVFGLADLPGLGDIFIRYWGSDFVAATEIFNPRRIWTVVVMVLSVNFVGYFISKLFGKGRGVSFLGLLGGLVSSTAITEKMASSSKQEATTEGKDTYVMGTILSNASSLMRILVVVFILNSQLALRISVPVLVMFLVSTVSWLLMRRRENINIDSRSELPKRTGSSSKLPASNIQTPFSLKPALLLAGVFFTVTVFTQLALYFMGDSGFVLASMASALSGLDAVAANTASVAGSIIPIDFAAVVLFVAICMNMISRLMISIFSADEYFYKKILRVFILNIVLGIIAMLTVVYL